MPAAQALPAAVVAPPAAGAPATLTTSVRPGIEAPPPSHQATTDSGTAGGASSGAGGQFADILFDGDQSPGVQISGTATLTEGGASGSYQVVLKTAPTDTVTVTLSADPALSLSASTFTFTPSNWSTPQSFTAVAVTDSDAEGFHAADIQSGTSSSSDPDYNSINGDTFVVNILDANGPNAVDDTVQTTQGVALPSINVLANDVDPNSYTLTVTGITQGDEGGAVSLNPDQTVSYTPATGYTGLDHFTYTIDNGHGQTTVGYVDVYVAPVEQAPVLAPVANQTNSEDDNVSLTVSGSDPDGDQVFYTASNLPLGLSINYLTGQISGQLAENAANPVLGQPVSNSHTYAVTVTGTDAAGLTSSQTFNWTINHTNHAPWLEFPGAFVGAPMTPANIQIVGHDPDAVPGRMIDQLTYSLTGTPASLTINPTTGLITGMFTAADVGTYNPQVTVSDGQLTATQSFALTVLSSPSLIPPATSLWVNGTADTSDDITTMDQPVPVIVNGTAGTTVNLSISGPAALDQSVVTLGQNGQATVTVTPTGPSQSVGDITLTAFVLVQGQQVQVDAKKLEAIQITLGDPTPTYQPYNQLPATAQTHAVRRIPPRQVLNYAVVLSLDLSKSTHAVTVSTLSLQAGSGTADFNGEATKTVQHIVNIIPLRGITMTTPGKQGNLVIQATIGKVRKQSPTFSVSAVPINLRYRDTLRNTRATVRTWPIRPRNGQVFQQPLPPFSMTGIYNIDSDSGRLQDLDQVWFGEFVQYRTAASNEVWSIKDTVPQGYTFVRPRPRDVAPAVRGVLLDSWVLPGAKMPTQKKEGTVTVDQYYGYRDGRAETVNRNDTTHAYQNDIGYFVVVATSAQPTPGNWVARVDRSTATGEFEPSQGLELP